MPNEIGWGNPVDLESGYGAAAATSTEGYGTVVINSYSGETNVSGIDVDNIADTPSLLLDGPNLYMDGDNMYLYVELNPAITYTSISYKLYLFDEFIADGSVPDTGIYWVAEYPGRGIYHLVLKINIDDTITEINSNNLEIE
jgi:hypothetical protein